MNSIRNESAPKDILPPSSPPGMPQSQVLNNPYLLELIFSSFRRGDRAGKLEFNGLVGKIPFPESQHLLWTSLVSKTFYDPAMNVLWRSLDSWVPLLRLIHVLAFNRLNITSKEIISEAHLGSMARYAKRVRHIYITQMKHTISPFIYGYIGQLLGGQSTTLIPALSTFHITNIEEISNDHIQCLLLLPCATISDVTICGIRSKPIEFVAASLLHRISQSSRVVKILKLCGHISSLSLNRIHELERLETLQLDMQGTSFLREVLCGLSQMKHLKQVYLTFDGASNFHKFFSFRPVVKSSIFGSLQDLRITSSAEIALEVLRCIEHPTCLDVVTLHFTSRDSDTSNPRRCLERITDTAKSLKSIQITSSNVNACIPEASLDCLCSLPLLEHINVTTDHLTARTFFNFWGPWLSVKSIRLLSKKITTQSTCQDSQSVPLGLSHLHLILDLCPNLESLLVSVEIDIKPTSIQDMQLSSLQIYGKYSTTESHGLSELALLPFLDSKNVLADNFSATVLNAVAVACFIDRICPHVQNCDLSQLTCISSDWVDGVQTIVKELQRTRNANGATSGNETVELGP